MRSRLEPSGLAPPKERVADREGNAAKRELRSDPHERLVLLDGECLPDASLWRGDPLVEDLNGDVTSARLDEKAREPPCAVVQLRLRDKCSPAADSDDLPVVLENCQSLTHDDSAHAEAPGELGLGRKRVAWAPAAGLDLLFENLLKLVVQGNKASPVQRATLDHLTRLTSIVHSKSLGHVKLQLRIALRAYPGWEGAGL